MDNPIMGLWAIVNLVLLVAFFTSVFLVVILGINGAGCLLGGLFVVIVLSGMVQGVIAKAIDG